MNDRELDAVRLLCHALLGAGKYARARQLLRGLAEQCPDDLWVRRNLVHALLRLGDYEEAEPLARGLVAAAGEGERAPALFFHAHSLWGCGRVRESKAAVDRYAEALAAE